MVYPFVIALIGPKNYFSRKKFWTKKNREINFTDIMVTEKKPILENVIEYIWVNNAQLDLVYYLWVDWIIYNWIICKIKIINYLTFYMILKNVFSHYLLLQEDLLSPTTLLDAHIWALGAVGNTVCSETFLKRMNINDRVACRMIHYII